MWSKYIVPLEVTYTAKIVLVKIDKQLNALLLNAPQAYYTRCI